MTVINKNNNESKILKIRGAGENNLKNINIDIPKNKFVVFTGVSGSGKSSLALILYTQKDKEGMLKAYLHMQDNF